MKETVSIFGTFIYYTLGIKGGLLFEKEGLFRPSFFIEERRIFTKDLITTLGIKYDSLYFFTKSNSLGIGLKFYKDKNFTMLDLSYTLLFQNLFIYKENEFMRSVRTYKGLTFAVLYGGHLTNLIYIASGIEYNSITHKFILKMEIGV